MRTRTVIVCGVLYIAGLSLFAFTRVGHRPLWVILLGGVLIAPAAWLGARIYWAEHKRLRAAEKELNKLR